MRKFRVLDLFSGIGGFSLGLERTGGFETVAFCEIEPFPRRVLAKHWPDVPCFEEVRKLRGRDVGPVDVICGGYPCQPFSTAGKRLGHADDRHLWPEFARLVEELRPAWVIGENVAGHVSMGLDDVLSDLEALGYACRAFIVPACAVDAPHRRDRIWIIANASCVRGTVGQPRKGGGRDICNIQRDCEGEEARRKVKQPRSIRVGPAANADHIHAQGQQPCDVDAQKWSLPGAGQAGPHNAGRSGFVLTEPPVRGADDGVPAGLDAARLKALGNAVVPQIPEMIGRAILAAELEAAE